MSEASANGMISRICKPTLVRILPMMVLLTNAILV